jgi:hypothetical protein
MCNWSEKCVCGILAMREGFFLILCTRVTCNGATQHKYADINFLYNRLNTYNLRKKDYKQEENIMHNISFPIYPQKPTIHKPRKHLDIAQTPSQKWATFTYTEKERTFITNIFRRANLKIAFRANNTNGNMLMHKQQITDRHTRSEVYT